MKQDIDNQISALETTTGLVHSLEIVGTLVHKRLKIEPKFYPSSVISAFYTSLPGVADGDQQTELNQTLPNGRQ